MKRMAEKPELTDEEYRVRSRRSVLTGGAAVLAGFLGWRGVQGSAENNNIPGVLRDLHEANEALWSKMFRDDHQAKTFPRSEATPLRINGRHGIRNEIDLAAWQLQVLGPDGRELGHHSLADIQALPKHTMTIEHKCIEGWAQVTNWGGARFRDFMTQYVDQLPPDISDVYLETPDGAYYVSVDLATMGHDQTLLAYEMVDEPLDDAHGAPLRLATPLKYGIKQIKRIGTIQFRRGQGDDYWGERGYDWYAGL